MAERKRLREARMKWIDEHEMPVDYSVAGKDGTRFATPFQVGIRTYDGEWKPENKNITFTPIPAEEVASDKEELDQLLAKASVFMGPGIYKESPHPPMLEGEDYGEYVTRVGSAYERQAGQAAVRRPVSDSDGVRESGASDPDRERGTHAAGPGAGGDDRAIVDCDAGADDPGAAIGKCGAGRGGESDSESDAAGGPPGAQSNAGIVGAGE